MVSHSGSCLRAGCLLPARLDSLHPCCFPLSLFSFLLSFFIMPSPSPFSMVVSRQMGRRRRLSVVVLVVVMVQRLGLSMVQRLGLSMVQLLKEKGTSVCIPSHQGRLSSRSLLHQRPSLS